MNQFIIYSNLWNEILANKSDPRTANWFMMSSPLPSFLICLAYVLIVYIGCFLMKNKRQKPFQLKNILIVYNFSMVTLSGYLFYEFLSSGWLFDYTLGCQPVDYSNSPKALRVSI